MLNIKKLLLLVIPVFLISITSCGEGGGSEGGEAGTTNPGATQVSKQGFHMPGRDCLACHNYDLQNVRHLTIGGTVFKSQNIKDINNVNNLCGGNLKIVLMDASNPSNTIDSNNYKDPNSKGYKGKGNVFILSRKLPNIQGSYYVQITDENGKVIAVSTLPHNFTSGYYDITNPADTLNRYSCNACHSVNPKGGAPGVIYPNANANLCK
ncbi:MAG: hypothetical protein D6834_01740 [Aquificota bacterium]|nr:MAG: hypothetical protein D6834_01740 [Aquificota bacterium]